MNGGGKFLENLINGEGLKFFGKSKRVGGGGS